ncbi:MAG: DDE transposase [Acidobacteria bacterium]|nr:MAG: DDE transposase [Acidobacteriota bacterium]
MEQKAMNEPTTLQEAIIYFADPVNCREYLVARRWPMGVTCPRCGSTDVLFLEKYNRWHCRAKHSAPQFTLKTGSIMEDSPISLDKWLMAMWLVVNSKNGISSYEIHRSIGVTQKTAWFLNHRIRLAFGLEPEEKLSGPVEMDETFIGGKIKNMHKNRKPKPLANRTKRLSGTIGKTIVVGMLERNGRVKAEVVMERTQAVLHELIHRNIAPGTTLITDEHGGYRGTSFEHQIINHANEYVRGQVHTNGIENFWSLLKRGLNGTYVSVEPFHLFRYIDEQVYRYNNRKMNDSQRFDLAVQGIIGKRLTFDELTGKVSRSTEVRPF